MAARPRTLPAAVAPVLVGTAAAVQWYGSLPRWGAFFAALVGSIFIQIGTNLANDYSDAKRGADQHRCDGGRQRPRTRRHEPDPHGRRGNFEKSGGRPSW